MWGKGRRRGSFSLSFSFYVLLLNISKELVSFQCERVKKVSVLFMKGKSSFVLCAALGSGIRHLSRGDTLSPISLSLEQLTCCPGDVGEGRIPHTSHFPHQTRNALRKENWLTGCNWLLIIHTSFFLTSLFSERGFRVAHLWGLPVPLVVPGEFCEQSSPRQGFSPLKSWLILFQPCSGWCPSLSTILGYEEQPTSASLLHM